MKSHPEMTEGPEGETRFMVALQTVLAAPQSAVQEAGHQKKERIGKA
jgi:hypothetical protein